MVSRFCVCFHFFFTINFDDTPNLSRKKHDRKYLKRSLFILLNKLHKIDGTDSIKDKRHLILETVRKITDLENSELVGHAMNDPGNFLKSENWQQILRF